MLATLILVLCLAADRADCRERHEVQLPGAVAFQECLVQGQHLAAPYLEERPRWRLGAWRCEPPGRRGA
jgi:hypothetical protein